MVEQNLAFAITLALLGGLFQVLSVLVLAYPEHMKHIRGKEYKMPKRRVLVPFNVFIQLFNGAATTGAAIFGPVAIIMPVTVSSQLLFNILIFGFLEMEEFGKDVQVGTFIVVLGAVFLPVVGPTIQQDQEIMELLSAPWSLAWTSFLFAGVVLSGISCFTCVNTKKWEAESKPVYITLTVARVFSSVLSASLSKALALVSGVPLIIVILGFLICGFVLGTSVVLQATKTEQKLFVPIISCGTQLVNAATGLILWEDWKVIQSWVGYSAVMIQIVVGVYLISSLDFFENTADTNYGMHQSVMLRNESVRTFNILTINTETTEKKDIENPEIKDDSDRTRALRKDFKKFREDNFVDNLEPSVTSIRGLIGGINKEPSYHVRRRKKTQIEGGNCDNVNDNKNDNTDADDNADDNDSNIYNEIENNKAFLNAIKLAELAAKRGDERFVTPPKVHDMDSVLTESSIENFPDRNENKS